MAARNFISQLQQVPDAKVLNESCMICLCQYSRDSSANGDREVAVRLPCNHIVGLTCISTWLLQENGTKNNTCPSCRFTLFDIPRILPQTVVQSHSQAWYELMNSIPPNFVAQSTLADSPPDHFEDLYETGEIAYRPFRPPLVFGTDPNLTTLGDPGRSSPEIGHPAAESTHDVLEHYRAEHQYGHERYLELLNGYQELPHSLQQRNRSNQSGYAPAPFNPSSHHHTTATAQPPGGHNPIWRSEPALPASSPRHSQQHPSLCIRPRARSPGVPSLRQRTSIFNSEPALSSESSMQHPDPHASASFVRSRTQPNRVYGMLPFGYTIVHEERPTPPAGSASAIQGLDRADEFGRDPLHPANHRIPMLPEQPREQHRPDSETLIQAMNIARERAGISEERAANLVDAAPAHPVSDPLTTPTSLSGAHPDPPQQTAPPLPPRAPRPRSRSSIPFLEHRALTRRRRAAPPAAPAPYQYPAPPAPPAAPHQYPASSTPPGFPYQDMAEGPQPEMIPAVQSPTDTRNYPAPRVVPPPPASTYSWNHPRDPMFGGPLRRERPEETMNDVIQWIGAYSPRPAAQVDQGPFSYRAPTPPRDSGS